MENLKRISIITVIIIIISAIIVWVCFYINNNKTEEMTEYTPQEEISQEQLRQTMLTLYFINENNIVPEIRLIDVKELIDNPYEKIINLLIQGPKNENFEIAIPKETKINKIQKDGDILIIDFSTEFINEFIGGEIKEKLVIQSLVKTLTELTEINGIKILINGEDGKKFKDGTIDFDKIFTREF